MSDHLFDGTFVEAFSKTTGQPQTIPASWIGDPVLGADFYQSDEQAEATKLAGDPNEDWTVPQMRDYARDHGVDLAGAKKHGDILAAITTHNETAAAAGQE